MNAKMTDAVVDGKLEAVKQATKYVKETENVAEKYSAMTVSKNSDMNMNVGELQSAAFTAVPTLKSVKKVRPTKSVSTEHRHQHSVQYRIIVGKLHLCGIMDGWMGAGSACCTIVTHVS